MEILLESMNGDRLENQRFVLASMIIADKILNRRGVIAILRGLWSEEVVSSIREMGKNRYCILFRMEVMMQRALDEGLWSVMRGSLILQRWSEGLTVEELNFSKVIFLGLDS